MKTWVLFEMHISVHYGEIATLSSPKQLASLVLAHIVSQINKPRAGGALFILIFPHLFVSFLCQNKAISLQLNIRVSFKHCAHN